MKSLAFPLACLLLAACGGSKKHTKDAEMEAEMTSSSAAATPGSDAGPAPLKAIYEIREVDGGKKVGMMFKRDHGEGRMIFWIYDAEGNRRGFVTEENRAYAYDYVLGQRSAKATFIGSDTISASARRVLGHDRVVELVQIDIDAWANPGEK